MKDNKEIQTVDKNVLRNLKKLFTSRENLANLTNLNSLYLEYCKSIKPKPSQWNMATRKKVASYQERIKKGMK